MLANRVRKSARHLAKWARRAGVTCYRLYDRDIPEMKLAIDWYDGRLHVAEYAPERDDAPLPEAGWLDALTAAVAAALDVAPEDVFVKRRERQRGTRQYEKLGERAATFVVEESGHRFRVNLSDYLDTGLFLDHRLTRARVQEEAAGRRFLNLFCYTGAFTVYAAAGGAQSTTSVDLSNTYLAWAEENLKLNGLDGPEHRLIRADVLAFLEDPALDAERYDLVVVDPPTFSNSKSMRAPMDLQRDHGEMLRRILARTAPGGVVYFSTNNRRFKLDPTALTGVRVEDISARTIPPDFRDPKIHRCWRLEKP